MVEPQVIDDSSSDQPICNHKPATTQVHPSGENFAINNEKAREVDQRQSERDPIREELRIGDESVQSRLVTWDGPDDPENPKNWPLGRKWRAVIAVSGFVLMSPLSTTIVAPALDVIAEDLSVTAAAEKPLILSIFMLGFAIGPLFISPMSEIFGRTRVLQSFNIGYLIFNTACGASQTKGQLILLRFLSGLFGSASVGTGAGTLGDMFEAHERGKAMAVYSVAPLIGPVLGPIAGGFLTKYASWRWAFYMSSILDACVQIWGIFFLEESYAPILLRRKKNSLLRGGATNLHTEYDFPNGSKMKVVKTNMIRPFKLLATQPVVQVLALYQGYLYGNIYILYAYFPTLWTERYHERLDIASLNYLSIGIGTAFAAEVTTHINDWIYQSLTKRNDGRGRPEFRVPIMIPATVVLAVGLFWYGWSAQVRLHWIMPNIGIGLFTAAAYICTLSNNTYIVDVYGRYSASGLAAISMLRCLAGFGFPIFSPYLYEALDYGWTNSMLGFIALFIGLPAVVFLWRSGQLLRQKSAYCATEE